MDKLRERMNTLRLETEQAQQKNEELAARVKVLEQENLTKEQEIASLTHRNSLLDGEVEKLEKQLSEAKSAADTGAAHGSEVDSLSRKVQLLEEEAEEADKNLRETNEKLRLTDVKAEHYERKVATVEAERDSWERKYEETCEKLKASQLELEEISKQLDSL
ncbi:tropomyosin [Morchella snyderi]|nr:tropomyosin [Morchella snyderi]